MKDEAEHQAYPKMLYLDGRVRTDEGRPVPHHHTVTVADEAEEAEARAEGFTDASEPEAVETDEAPEVTADEDSQPPEVGADEAPAEEAEAPVVAETAEEPDAPAV